MTAQEGFLYEEANIDQQIADDYEELKNRCCGEVNETEEIEQLEETSMRERLNNLRKEKDEKLYDQQLLLLKKKEELEDCIKTKVWKFKNLTKKSRKRSSTKSRKRRGTKSPKRRSAKSPKRRGIKKLI